MDLNLFTPESPKNPAIRLAQNYIPYHYNIFIRTDIPNKILSGKVDIFVKRITEQCPDYMELHVDPTLIIMSVTKKDIPLTFQVDPIGKLTINGKQLDVDGPITISYVGTLNHQWKGMFYIDDDSCCTQFEPNDARKAFPCYDEPWAKATFTISLCHKSELTALSNMPAVSVTPSTYPNESVTLFQETPPMCTYLVAMAVGKYSCVTGQTSRGLPVDIYASQGNEQYLHLPLQEAIKALNYLESYFDMEFNLPRLQILAAKHFMFGGMENYGLIIIIEKLFLKPPMNMNEMAAYEITPMERQMIDMLSAPNILDQMANFMRHSSLMQLSTMMDEQSATLVVNTLSQPACFSILSQVITHEIVHMWAGDIVSPKWWDALWLNEGFATLLPSLMFDEYHPEFTFIKLYDDSTNQMALALDSLEGTRPIHGSIISESDGFDMMSYNKAGAVLRMIRNLVGPIRFRNAYRSFLKDFCYKSADTIDLMQKFMDYFDPNGKNNGNISPGEGAFNFDVKKFFDAWIYKDGFPLIVLEDNFIRQMPFSPGDEKRIWPIPLQILYGKQNTDEVKTKTLFLEGEELKIDDIDADWVIINPGLESFCRVWYVGDWLTNAIVFGLKHLNEREKSIFRIDLMLLCTRGYVDSSDVELLQSYY